MLEVLEVLEVPEGAGVLVLEVPEVLGCSCWRCRKVLEVPEGAGVLVLEVP